MALVALLLGANLAAAVGVIAGGLATLAFFASSCSTSVEPDGRVVANAAWDRHRRHDEGRVATVSVEEDELARRRRGDAPPDVAEPDRAGGPGVLSASST